MATPDGSRVANTRPSSGTPACQPTANPSSGQPAPGIQLGGTFSPPRTTCPLGGGLGLDPGAPARAATSLHQTLAILLAVLLLAAGPPTQRPMIGQASPESSRIERYPSASDAFLHSKTSQPVLHRIPVPMRNNEAARPRPPRRLIIVRSLVRIQAELFGASASTPGSRARRSRPPGAAAARPRPGSPRPAHPARPARAASLQRLRRGRGRPRTAESRDSTSSSPRRPLDH
jgi:hypothetical protein